MGKKNRIRRAQKKSSQAKRAKISKRKKIHISNKSVGPVFQMLPNPFADVSDEKRAQIITEISEESEKSYQKSLAKVREILTKYDPILLLSILASYGLSVGVGDNGIQKSDSDATIYQSHVEICQAIALQINPDNLQRELCGPQVVQELWDSLTELTRSYGNRGMTQLLEDESKDKKEIKILREWIKTNTLMVRNWGYFFQVKSISKELYKYFDELLEESYGFSASNVIDLFQLLIHEIEKANTKRYKILSSLYKIKNKRKLIFKYHEELNLPNENVKEFIENYNIKSIPFKSLFSMLMFHYDLRLPEVYEFEPAHLAKKISIGEHEIEKILDRFSHSWGSLESNETEHLYLANPVWLHPIIKLEQNKYFCAFPQVFFSFVLQSLDDLISTLNKDLVSKRRANYLEEKITEIINRKFPSSNTASSIKWSINNDQFETDLITFIDSHAIIVEAKSGKITDPALRGAPARLKRHIEEILIEPNTQSRRLKTRLEELIANPNLNDDLREKLPADLTKIHKIIRLSVSLEDFGSIQANIAKLRDTGWLPDDFEPCPTMNLADFEILFDFLDNPVQIIHYLEARQEIEDLLDYKGGELDLMGLYIGTLFNFGNIEPNTNLVITEMSHPLDVYYSSKSEGIETPKPVPKITPLFISIMQQLQKRKKPRWTEIGVILNSLNDTN